MRKIFIFAMLLLIPKIGYSGYSFITSKHNLKNLDDMSILWQSNDDVISQDTATNLIRQKFSNLKIKEDSKSRNTLELLINTKKNDEGGNLVCVQINVARSIIDTTNKTGYLLAIIYTNGNYGFMPESNLADNLRDTIGSVLNKFEDDYIADNLPTP